MTRRKQGKIRPGNDPAHPSVKLFRPAFTEKCLETTLFLFFLLSPLVVASGYLENKLFCTLYDLPKFWFTAAGSLLLATVYFLYLAFYPATGKAAGSFFCRNPGWKILGLLLVWMGFSLLSATVPETAIVTWLVNLLMGGLAVVLGQLFLVPKRRWLALYGLFIGFAAFVGLGLFQAAGGRLSFLMPILGPASTLGYRNPAAHFIVLVLPFLLFATFHRFHFWRKRQGRLSLFLVMSLVLTMTSAVFLLFLLACRIAFLILAVELLILCLIWGVKMRGDGRRHWLKVLAGGMAGVVLVSALIMVFPYSRERVKWSWHRYKQGGVAYLLEGRYYHWGNTLVMIREHPLLGVGPGNFRVAYPLYCRSFAYDPFMNYHTRIKKAHNDYLQLAAECGIPALFFFLLLWGRQFYLLCYPENDGIDGEEGWRLPLAGSLGAYSIIMLFSFPLEMAYGRMFFFFLIGLGEARAWSDKYIFRRRSV